MRNPKVSKVSLALSRFDGARYQRLDTEPIRLREISYQDGVLLSLSRDGIMPVKSVQEMLKFLLAEIVKTYL